MLRMEEFGGEEFFLAHPDPVVLELNRLHNQLKEKDQELGKAQSEIKALRATEALKDKAVEELQNETERLEDKLRVTENHLEQKNLDIKKLAIEKKEAVTAQYAAEATLRRVYADQKDNDSVPLESIIAPLEAEIKMYKNEILILQENTRALERLTKSKEAALLEAEKILESALERVLIVEEVQNQNFELRRQIEICQEENKILDKTYRQKVSDVEKLSRTIIELEEAILAGGAAANTVRDYRRQISELQEEKRTLERELARAKVSANRVASVVANEWKDENDKVMPVKQWLEERRLLQAEMQRLRDKLVISERAVKAEAQMKDKLKLRLKTLEEGLKQVSNSSTDSKSQRSNHFFGILSSNSGPKKRASSQPRGSTSRKTDVNRGDEKSTSLKQRGSGESLLRKSLWASRHKVVDIGEKENIDMKVNTSANADKPINNEIKGSGDARITNNDDSDDIVSGFLYDKLQKEVINLRKTCEVKDGTLEAKDEEIKVLMKKIETLTKVMEVESKKMKREAAIREKDSAASITDEKTKNTNYSKRFTRASSA